MVESARFAVAIAMPKRALKNGINAKYAILFRIKARHGWPLELNISQGKFGVGRPMVIYMHQRGDMPRISPARFDI